MKTHSVPVQLGVSSYTSPIRILNGIKARGEAIAGTMAPTNNAEPIQKAMGWHRNLRRAVLCSKIQILMAFLLLFSQALRADIPSDNTNPSAPSKSDIALNKIRSSVAQSKKAKSKKVAPKPKEEVIVIPIPQTYVNLESQYPVENKKDKYIFDIQVSNWTPDLIKEDFYFNNNAKFDQRMTSQISLQLAGASIANWKNVALKPVIGMSFAEASKSVDIIFHENATRVEEKFNFYILKMGLEATTEDKLLGSIEPIARVCLLPMWTQSASTEINKGIDRTSSALEYSLGAGFSHPKLSKALGFDDIAFQIGVEKTTGLRGVPYEGTGYFLGTRIKL